MKKIHNLLLAGAMASCASTAVFAAESAPVEFSANVSLTSDYVWRGFTQTYKKPALQGGFDLSHESGVYIGTWGSNVRFVESGPSDGAHLELDLYAGYSHEFKNGVGLDVGYNRYMYPGAESNLDYDFGEFYVSGNFNMITLGYNYAPEFFGNSGKAHYFSLGLEYALPHDFTLGASVGYQKFSDNSDANYTDWGLSISKSFGGADFTLAYTDTNIDGTDDPDDLAKGRAVFSISKSF